MENFRDCSSGHRTEGKDLRIVDYLGSTIRYKPGNSMLQNANLDSKLVADIPIYSRPNKVSPPIRLRARLVIVFKNCCLKRCENCGLKSVVEQRVFSVNKTKKMCLVS